MSEYEPKRTIELYESCPLGVVSLGGVEYVYAEGLTNEQVSQLKSYSLDTSDTALQEATSDYERFGSGNYESWFSKKRTPFVLIDASVQKLAAIIWFGPKTLGRPSLKHLNHYEKNEEQKHSAGDWHTVSYRAYPGYRGKGLMSSFCMKAIADYRKIYPDVKLWLSIDTYNEASFHIAEKLGFTRNEEYTNESTNHFVYIYG